MSNLGENVANCRKLRNITQKELAEEIGVNPSFISLLESGKSSAALWTILKIATALEVQPDQLLEELKEDKSNSAVDSLVNELIKKTKNKDLTWSHISIENEDKETGVKIKDFLYSDYNRFSSFTRYKKYYMQIDKECYVTNYKDDKYYLCGIFLIPHDDKKVATKSIILFLYGSGKDENNEYIFINLETDENNSKLYELYCLIDEETDTELIALNFLNRLKD